MQKKFLSLIVVSIALLLFLGAGLQDPGLVGATEEEPLGDETALPLAPQPEEPAALETEAGENPDGLEEPVEPVEAPAPELVFPAAAGKLLSAPATRGTSGGPDANGNFEPWGVPGSLKLDKTATPVEGTSNQWLVTLTLEGKDKEVETTSDIVLVIDRSGSMKGSRMTKAIAAAKSFVNELLADPTDTSTRIAVVSYASNVTVHNQGSPFKDASGKQALLDVIGGLKADGGTFTQAGLREARLLLNSSTADNRVIVLLSDGEPTYSYPIISVSSKRNETYFTKVSGGLLGLFPDWYSRDDLAENVFNYNSRVGSGSTMTTYISIDWRLRVYHYHHGHSAIAESRFAQADGITVYAVGLEASTDGQHQGQDILDRIAPDRSYEATESDLEAIFLEIAGSVTKIAAARNCTVIDPLGDMFSIVPAAEPEITVNRGTAIYDPLSRTITWSDFTVREGYPATMSYIVEIDPSAQSGVLYPTNKPTHVDYTNVLGDPAKKYFPIPKAGIEAAGSIKITKTVQDDDGSGKRFPIYVVRAEDGRTWSALLAHGETASITGLGVGTYSISEVIPMGYEFISISSSPVIFTVENPTAEFTVTVINKKVNKPWFWDEDEKTNTFKVGLW